MNRPRVFIAVLILTAAVALAIRVPRLGLRPMHADEAVQAALFRDLWQEGRYQYDPREFHGPTLAYTTYPFVWLSGIDTFAHTRAATFRMVPVLLGAGSVLLLWLLRDALGRVGSLWGAAFLAGSPACVFYSRYYIHETLLVCFTLGALACGWRYARSGRWSWCAAAGAAVGLMQATKETAVLSYAAAALALCVAGWCARPARWGGTEVPRRAVGAHLAVGALSALGVAALLFSSFGTHGRGPWDGILTYLIWLRRAGGESPHVHPWYFYLQRLLWWRDGSGWVWSEAFIAGLACVGLASALVRRGRPSSDVDRGFVRFLGIYTVLVAAVYAALPYKTPWCLLQFWLGALLLAGVGVDALWRAARRRWVRGALGVVLAAGTGHLLVQAYWASYVLPADPRNPYVYAQTSPDVVRLESQLQGLSQASEQQADTPLQVIWDDPYYWPLPWYVRRFTHVQWWTAVPDAVTAPLVISSPQYDAELTRRLDATHIMADYFQLRPQVLAQLWVRQDLWESYLRHQP